MLHKALKATQAGLFTLGLGLAVTLTPVQAHASDAACDPAVEEAIKKAAEEGYRNAIEGIQEDVIKPASVKVASCLDDILNSGFGLDFLFKPPSLSGILNSIAKRVCDKANDMFKDATSKLTDALPTDAFEEFGIKINTKIRQGQSDRISLNPRIYSGIDGKRIDIDRVTGGSTGSDLQGQIEGIFQ